MTDRSGCWDGEAGAQPGAFAPPDAAGGRPTAPREIDSRLLMGSATTVAIRHGTEVYTLRVTRAGKLILTK